MTAPVAFFIFNRPQLTAEVYERIRAGQPSRLLVIADGPWAILSNKSLVTNIGIVSDATRFKEKHSVLGVPARELGQLVQPRDIVAEREADDYTFAESLAGKRIRHEGDWLSRVRQGLRIGRE